MEPRRITVFDTTLRDGEQSPGCSMNLEEKLQVARQLERLGVDVIEAGFPVASEDDFAAVQAIARSCRQVGVAALCRVLPADINRAWEAIQEAARPRLHTFLSTSDIHLAHKLHMTRTVALAMIRSGVRQARSLCAEVEFSAEDATRTDPAFLMEVFKVAIEEGATIINVPDTVGYTYPTEFSRLLHFLRDNVPGMDGVLLSVHCHNDLGLAVANSLAALEAGAGQVECTLNGIGERAGNAALEELVMALVVRKDFLPFTTGIHTEELHRSSQTLSNITGIQVQPNKAIVGRNAFAHESGIHQHGVLQNPVTYEIMTPESIGLNPSRLVLGKHSGRHALGARFEEMGFPLEKPALDKAYKLFIKLCDQKKEIFEEDLVAIVQDGLVQIPEAFKLRRIEATAGTATLSTACVTLAFEGQERTVTATGDGPVNAACAAMAQISGIPGQVRDYTVHSLTAGDDAVGEVFMRVDFDGLVQVGKAASTDVVDASARAYLHALNKAIYARHLARV